MLCFRDLKQNTGAHAPVGIKIHTAGASRSLALRYVSMKDAGPAHHYGLTIVIFASAPRATPIVPHTPRCYCSGRLPTGSDVSIIAWVRHSRCGESS